MAMNLNNVVAITDGTLTTVRATYVLGSSDKEYTFLVKKELVATPMYIGDVLVARTRSNLALVRVTAIDEETDIEPDAEQSYNFAFQLVNTDTLTLLEHDHEEKVKALAKRRRQHLRNQLVQQAMSSISISSEDGV